MAPAFQTNSLPRGRGVFAPGETDGILVIIKEKFYAKVRLFQKPVGFGECP
jgi:hypothetical protein